jgi:hypothetical protein
VRCFDISTVITNAEKETTVESISVEILIEKEAREIYEHIKLLEDNLYDGVVTNSEVQIHAKLNEIKTTIGKISGNLFPSKQLGTVLKGTGIRSPKQTKSIQLYRRADGNDDPWLRILLKNVQLISIKPRRRRVPSLPQESQPSSSSSQCKRPKKRQQEGNTSARKDIQKDVKVTDNKYFMFAKCTISIKGRIYKVTTFKKLLD